MDGINRVGKWYSLLCTGFGRAGQESLKSPILKQVWILYELQESSKIFSKEMIAIAVLQESFLFFIRAEVLFFMWWSSLAPSSLHHNNFLSSGYLRWSKDHESASSICLFLFQSKEIQAAFHTFLIKYRRVRSNLETFSTSFVIERAWYLTKCSLCDNPGSSSDPLTDYALRSYLSSLSEISVSGPSRDLSGQECRMPNASTNWWQRFSISNSDSSCLPVVSFPAWDTETIKWWKYGTATVWFISREEVIATSSKLFKC